MAGMIHCVATVLRRKGGTEHAVSVLMGAVESIFKTAAKSTKVESALILPTVWKSLVCYFLSYLI
jgi:hypothetical protein